MAPPISLGRVVHYRLPDLDGQERLRAALAVQVFPPVGEVPLANLTAFLDPLNDGRSAADRTALEKAGRVVYADARPDYRLATTMHVGSAREGTGVGEWRWPARV